MCRCSLVAIRLGTPYSAFRDGFVSAWEIASDSLTTAGTETSADADSSRITVDRPPGEQARRFRVTVVPVTWHTAQRMRAHAVEGDRSATTSLVPVSL